MLPDSHALKPAILVVDDDLAIRSALRLLLEDEGYSVFTANDGSEALTLLHATHRPLVVLLDYVMPRLDGLDVLRAIRADARLATHRAFVLCTAQACALPSELHAIRAELGVPLLAKPFDLETLLAVVIDATHRLAERLTQRLALDSTLPNPVHTAAYLAWDSEGRADGAV